MKDWQITKEGNYIVVKQLSNGIYIPTAFFEGLRPFHLWAVEISKTCKSLGDLAEEIEKIYRGVFQDNPKGMIWDGIKEIEALDEIK